MAVTKYWNTTTGQWVAGSFSDGILPAAGDSVIADGRSQKSFIASLDRTGDTGAAGLNLAKFETTEDFVGDIGEPSNPLKLTADLFIHRGKGKLYFQSKSGSANASTDRLIIDTPNLVHEIQLCAVTDVSRIIEIILLRGKARYFGLPHADRIVVGYHDNMITDAVMTIDLASGLCRELVQYGGQLFYNGLQYTVDDHMLVAGGYCFFNGVHETLFQTGGHIEVAALTGNPHLTTAWLLGGSMDAGKIQDASADGAIAKAYISPQFDLIESRPTWITSRVKLWE